MTRFTLEVPGDRLLALKTPGAIRRRGTPGRSSGAAARPAAMPVPVFMTKLADYAVTTLNMSEAEIREDAQHT